MSTVEEKTMLALLRRAEVAEKALAGYRISCKEAFQRCDQLKQIAADAGKRAEAAEKKADILTAEYAIEIQKIEAKWQKRCDAERAKTLQYVIACKQAPGEARIRITADFEQEILDEIADIQGGRPYQDLGKNIEKIIDHEHHVWHLEEENEGCDVSCCDWCSDLRAVMLETAKDEYQKGAHNAIKSFMVDLGHLKESAAEPPADGHLHKMLAVGLRSGVRYAASRLMTSYMNAYPFLREKL